MCSHVLVLCCVGESMDDKPKEVNPEVTLERDEELLKVRAAVSTVVVDGLFYLIRMEMFSLSCNHTNETFPCKSSLC